MLFLGFSKVPLQKQLSLSTEQWLIQEKVLGFQFPVAELQHLLEEHSTGVVKPTSVPLSNAGYQDTSTGYKILASSPWIDVPSVILFLTGS